MNKIKIVLQIIENLLNKIPLQRAIFFTDISELKVSSVRLLGIFTLLIFSAAVSFLSAGVKDASNLEELKR